MATPNQRRICVVRFHFRFTVDPSISECVAIYMATVASRDVEHGS